eukprot:scaffold9951_cov66-Phaeocystis_antarctica.AAC.2
MPRPVPTDPLWSPRGARIGKGAGVRSAHRQHPAQEGCVARRAAMQLSAHHGSAPDCRPAVFGTGTRDAVHGERILVHEYPKSVCSPLVSKQTDIQEAISNSW